MYFDNIFANYESNIQSFIDSHKLSLVHKMYFLGQESYLMNFDVNTNDYSFLFGHDIQTTLTALFGLNSHACSSFISLINDFNFYFFNKDKMRNIKLYRQEKVSNYMEDINAICIKRSIDENGIKCLTIMSFKSEISIIIREQGVIVKPSYYNLNQQLVSISDNDISTAIIQAIKVFREQLAIVTGFAYQEVNSSNIDEFKKLSLSSAFNANTIQDMFTYPDKNKIFNTINLLNQQHSVSQAFCAENNVMFVSNKSSIFVNIMQNCLETSIFEKFITAFNLHHNYQALISKKYLITLNFSENHPIDFERAFFDVSFGDFAVVFSDKNESNDFHIFTIKDNINKTIIYSNDLSELYDLVYSTVDSLIINSIEKSLIDMSFKDCEVFMMQHI